VDVAGKQRVVVGVDGSTGARAALAWALTDAAGRSAAVEVVTAFPVDFYWADPLLLDTGRIAAIRSDTEARARATVESVRTEMPPAADDVDVQVLVVAGAPAAHLVQRSHGAALLVVGSRGRGGLRSTVAGSVALHCSAHARCPVVVVHGSTPPAGEPSRVVVGLDDSDVARAALVAAVAAAASDGAAVDAVLAYEAPDYWSDVYEGMTPPLGETREQARARGEAIVAEVLPDSTDRNAVRIRAVEGHPGPVLVREAEGARLLVVGCRSRNQLPGLVLGSAALHCVMHAPCPVMVVHQPPADSSADGAKPLTAAASTTD
jgi:nucleotide-binding universal stress UspA family protein